MNKQQQHQEEERRLLPHLDSSPSSSKMIAPVRVARNVAEKQRRDKLNAFIVELANSVPLVASATKRLDKTSILRLAAAFLRLHDSPLNAIGYDLTSKDIVDGSASSSDSSSLSSWKPKIFPDHIKSLMEGLEGFVIVVNCDLKLIYVAQTCEKFLGHQNIDMMGFPLTAFIHPGDVDAVRYVMNEARKDVLRSGKKESQRIQIRCRMKERSQPRTEVVTYQMVQIIGSFQFPNNQDFSSTSSISSSRLHYLVNNNNDVKNMNNNLISSSLSPTSIDNSMDSVLDEGSSVSSFILSPSPAVIHRSDSTSSGCSSATTSSLYSSPRFSVKRKFEDLACPSSETMSGISCATNGKRLATSSSLPPSPALTGNSNNNNSTSEALIRQQQQIVTPTYVAKNLLFKGFVQVIPSSPMAELSLIDANQEEYVTRLSLDGVLLYADHRISTVAGYMPDEVVGRSAYAYILVPDHVISLFAHKLMLSNSNGTGIIVHRLRKRTGEYVYLQSAGCLQYDRSTGQVDHFICVSRLLHEEEGDKERQKFVKRFTPHIASDSPSALYESLQLVIGPKNSRAVKYQSFVSGSSFTSGPASTSLIPEQESSSECLAIESAQMNPMSHRQVKSIASEDTCYPLHSSPSPSTVVSTPSESPQLLLQPLPYSPPQSIPTIITHQQQMLQPTLVQNNNQMENLIFTSNRQESQGMGHFIERTDPTIFVNLPSSASGIMADGTFAETSDMIAVQQQQPSFITQAVTTQQQFLSQPQQVIVDANGTVLGQLSPSLQTQPLLMNQEMNSSVYPNQNLPQDIRSLLQPNQVILDRLRRHANNARYVMSNTSHKSSGDTSVYTMSRVLNQNGSDPMTGAIVFGVNETDSMMNPSVPSTLPCTIQTNPSLTTLSLMTNPRNSMSNYQQQQQQHFEQEAQFQQELQPAPQQHELQEEQQYSAATVLIRNYSTSHS